ncbi:MAG: hypothetical protein A3C80_03595 [Candidatus Ryanbacteria bacterium RIFCSPHIGHO2_02_FULL_45_43]|uniref:Uncharacterized protein n=1 Tax=Candidatus Ryanbacteria bacterium RIFCSPHIGHO2_01_45_13 TaxID=1802112 RepID=A0A1G2G1R6_9BACT|nr:MAG: hypothetical protein A2718_03860 [Candidatus Ryanbacteria bacterium RIFCSPHIGHO2_01_FULL_44_130]OGZ43801.1 MAG: hypothetical protein A2W41_00230 [Candidatus Ryanbacteria bacterium RIFCSPHIGHO2_01_45_13]OGZ48011.1 MAG: hypothetical protein A3C80_03595 [Candidatus Ryanbacteria bacterium RIFCSPHIGHO2_02_FULL_45_43]OGZ50147.1 MAG: hypothetical protein A3E55_01460 [Candidatus Ryanbacteria bacterium RIFCSPHIGHO2_12_FULL_44_20]OGZ51149.1 MAG: hypothetical protein A3A17_03900 [Candidatus Ryanba
MFKPKITEWNALSRDLPQKKPPDGGFFCGTCCEGVTELEPIIVGFARNTSICFNRLGVKETEINMLVVTESTKNGHGCVAMGKNQEEIMEFLRKRITSEICENNSHIVRSETENNLSLEWDSDVICVRWPTEALVATKLDSPHFFQILTVESPPFVTH